MRVLIKGCEPQGRILARQLAAAGHEVGLEDSGAAGPPDAVVLAVTHRGDLEQVGAARASFPGTPLLVLARAPLPKAAEFDDAGLTVMFPGFGEGSPGRAEQRGLGALGLPGTVVGPLAGPPRVADRRFVALLRSAGIRASLRENMQAWLTVTSAWLGPLRGAVAAAARQGLTLDATPDLVTLAARAARERLRLVRHAGLPLPPAGFCLVNLPETWAIKTVREIACALRDGNELPGMPSCEEAALVAGRLKVLAREHGIRTPAADFLDGFTREEAARTAELVSVAEPERGAWKRPGRW